VLGYKASFVDRGLSLLTYLHFGFAHCSDASVVSFSLSC
jgi:hypothetical protein